MRVLLLAMPDSVNLVDSFARFPNIALVSLAGSLPDHEVKVMDLVAYRGRIRQPLTAMLTGFRPEVVGLSAMTFQFDSLLRIARLVRRLLPDARLVAGGYHASLMAEEVTAADPTLPVDFMVRGEGEATFAELLAALAAPTPEFREIRGLSYRRDDGTWRHHPARELVDLASIPLPNRRARVNQDFGLFGRKGLRMDVIETSRGCPFGCKFCSIRHMYGKSFRRFPIERILADLREIRSLGFRGVFIVDDNITYDHEHLLRFCNAVVEHGLNDLFYIVQVSAIGLVRHPEVVAAMARANFHIVFVGFESMLPASLADMSKPTSPDINRQAAALVRQHGMALIAGTIVGFPDDTAASVRANFRAVQRLWPDVMYPFYLTPYPKTELREEMLAAGLVTNPDDLSRYDAYTCNIRTKHLSQNQLYRTLRVEMVRSFFYLPVILHNWFIRRYGLLFVVTMIQHLGIILWQSLTLRNATRRDDLPL
jgi:radical SAM superfamily enzyme YgiQ (UPF0313 family)